MLTLIVVFAVVLLAVITVYENDRNKLRAVIREWNTYADQLEAQYSDLWANHDATRRELNRIAPYAMNDLIRQGKVKASKLTYTENHNPNGKPVESSVYAISMFDDSKLLRSSDYAPEFAPDGAIVYAPIPVKTEEKSNGKAKDSKPTDKTKDNGKAKNDSKPSDNAKAIASDKSAFTPSIDREKAMKILTDDIGEELAKLLGREDIEESEADRAVELIIKWETNGKSKSDYVKWLASDLKSKGKSK